MKDFQHGRPFISKDTVLFQSLLRETVADIPSDTACNQEASSKTRMRVHKTLHEAIECLKEEFKRRIQVLNKKDRTKSDRLYWQMRGRQEQLHCVTNHLQKLYNKHETSYELYLALKDYLGCLEKYEGDVEEERQTSHSTSRTPILKWKAEGAAQELPVVFAYVTPLLVEYAPLSERHMLSFDGTTLEPLYREQGKRTVKNTIDEGERSLSKNMQSALGPFPTFPEGLSTYQQELLTKLENALSRRGHIQVKIQGCKRENIDLLWACVDRLLQYTPIERILILPGTASLKRLLCQTYEEWESLEDGELLSEHYKAKYTLTDVPGPETRICIASVREVQLVLPERQGNDELSVSNGRSALTEDTFDAIMIYGAPTPSFLWQRVLAYFRASHVVCFTPLLWEYQ